MPSRGFYDITSREEGKTAESDQSYRSCVCTLLIFFCLCIIIILATLPWKKSYHHSSESSDEKLETMQHHQHRHESPTERTTTRESFKYHQNNGNSFESTTSKPEVITERSDTSSSRESEKFMYADTTTERESSTDTTDRDHNDSSTINTNLLLQNFTLSTESVSGSAMEEHTRDSTEESEIYTTQSYISTDSHFVNEIASEYTTYESTEEEVTITDNSLSTAAIFDDLSTAAESTVESTIETEETTTDDSLSTAASLDKNTATESITESTTEVEESTTTDDSLSTAAFLDKNATTESITESTIEDEESTTTDDSLSAAVSLDNYNTTTENTDFATEDERSTTDDYVNGTFFSNKEITTDSTTESAIENESTTIRSATEDPKNVTIYSTISTVESTASTTSAHRPKRQVCTTGQCKNMASKMLFYMNHTADPCEDFYEYACGGFEANPQVVERNLENVAYQRILRQVEKEMDGKVEPSLFTKYYNSCMQYEHINQTERIRLARRALGSVGKFYTSDNEAAYRTNFTDLVAKLLLHNSALLFNIVPTLDEFSPGQFTLKIGPTTYRSPFDTEETEDPCHANRDDREDQNVDLEELYKEYKTCKVDTRKFVASISEALTALGVFSELNNTYIAQYINTTVIHIDMEIVKGFLANYPSKDKIREAYLMKNYTRVTVADLQRDSKIVNWTSLFYSLMKHQVYPYAPVQIYFYDALMQGLKSLEDFGARSPMQLNNALLGLYAHDLYSELVLSKHRNLEKHCLRVAANILIPEASNLYISSFSNDEVFYMNRTIRGLFERLKETLTLKVKDAEWAAEEGRAALIAKINDLKVAVPDISYFTDDHSTYRYVGADQVTITENYFENSMTLLRRYRMLMYKEFFTNPGDPEQIWTQYATPYQSKGLVIYRLNLVVIPFGVIDWSTKCDESLFDYVTLATLGTVIAHQIAHHFDANGIYYWNGTRDAEYSLLNDNDSTNSNFKDYINCQRNILYQSPTSIELPSTGQIVSYQITQLTLNERLSETMGLRLAYDTLDRLRSRAEVNLPWLELNSDQLFYLTYAQMYCTKLPLTSSYVSLYEDEQLPSRVHVFVSASNNRLLGEAWNCPEGSRIIPSSTCSVFPYLEAKDETGVTYTANKIGGFVS